MKNAKMQLNSQSESGLRNLKRCCLEALTKGYQVSRNTVKINSTFRQQRALQGRATGRQTAPPLVLVLLSLDFRLAHKLYARTPLQKSPLVYGKVLQTCLGAQKNK